MENIVELLKSQNKTISTMESCTGGGIANAITNVERASDVIKFSAVTYSNEFKIKMGVNEDIINMYSVYSMDTAHEMSKRIAEYAMANIGVGVTGKLNRVDKNNEFGQDNIVYLSIYDRDFDIYYDKVIEVNKNSRSENKEMVIDIFKKLLADILRDSK